jgi:hypothetical protein
MGRYTILDRSPGWIGDTRDREGMEIYGDVMGEADEEGEDEWEHVANDDPW